MISDINYDIFFWLKSLFLGVPETWESHISIFSMFLGNDIFDIFLMVKLHNLASSLAL